MDRGLEYLDRPERSLTTNAPKLIFCWPFLEFDQLLSNIRELFSRTDRLSMPLRRIS